MEGMEGEPKVYDRERVAQEAMAEARELIAARGLDELEEYEYTTSVINLMKELADDNANRHVVEALARILNSDSLRADIAAKEAELQRREELHGYPA